MVEREAQVGDRRDAQAVVVVGDHLLGHAIGREDAHLRRIEDGNGDPSTRRTRIGDREGATGQIVGPELLRSSPRREISERGREAAQPHAVGAADDGHDEALVVEIHGDPDVHRAVDDQRLAVDRGVEKRKLAQRVDHGAGDERQRGESCRRSDPFDLREVGRDERQRVRRRALRGEQRGRARRRTLLNGTTSSNDPTSPTGGTASFRRCRGARRRHGKSSSPGSEEARVSVTAPEGTPYTAAQARRARRGRARHAHGRAHGGGLPSPRPSPTSGWPSCRAPSMTARSRCASRTVRSSRYRAPATKRCCSVSPVICGPATTGSSPTTATARSCSRWGSRPRRCCCKPSAPPTIRRRAGGRCRLIGAHASSTSSARRRAPAASACPRSGARKRRATSAGAPISPGAPRTATSSPTCRWATARLPKASSGSRSIRRVACTSRCSTWSPTTATRSRCGRPIRPPLRSPRWCTASAASTS